MQHKEGTVEGFTATYGCKRLLHFEGYQDIRTAIAREKQLNGWRREKKLNLSRTINPELFARSTPSSKTLHRPGDGR
jgi:putative endonuclease